MVDVNSIVENPKNANKHSIEQIERLEKLIKYQGFRNPMIVSNRTGFLIVGHGRLEAARNIGMEKVPVIYQDFESEAQEYAYLISDNEIARWAELDKQAVYDGLKEIELDDIELLGLEDFEIPDIEELEPQTDEDEVPEVEHPITRRGDIWLLGKHRLMCGDSVCIDDYQKLMNKDVVDMVFSDPPYGYSYESNYQNKHKELLNDDTFLDYLPVVNIFMSDNSTIYLCTSFQVVNKWIDLFKEVFNYKNLIVWEKNNWSMGDLKGAFAGQHELIIFGSKGKQNIIGKREPDIWKYNRKAPDLHPTMKPVELVEYALSKWQSGKVLDPFMGSGTTLIACEKTNKQCYGMELDEKYCDVIINRWQNYTGKKATLESTKQTYEELKVERDGE